MLVQPAFSYLPDTIQALTSVLSPARLEPYRRHAGGDEQLMLQLYRWNMLLGESLGISLHLLEVALRNAIARHLHGAFGQDWHLQARFRSALQANWLRRALDDALERQRRLRSVCRPSPDPVIADLAFGFWATVVQRRHQAPMKLSHRLDRIFPHARPSPHHDRLLQNVNNAKRLRDRIAHHEPIHTMKLPTLHRDILETVESISRPARWMAERYDCFPNAYLMRPGLPQPS